jgi:hypothetical protein
MTVMEFRGIYLSFRPHASLRGLASCRSYYVGQQCGVQTASWEFLQLNQFSPLLLALEQQTGFSAAFDEGACMDTISSSSKLNYTKLVTIVREIQHTRHGLGSDAVYREILIGS